MTRCVLLQDIRTPLDDFRLRSAPKPAKVRVKVTGTDPKIYQGGVRFELGSSMVS